MKLVLSLIVSALPVFAAEPVTEEVKPVKSARFNLTAMIEEGGPMEFPPKGVKFETPTEESTPSVAQKRENYRATKTKHMPEGDEVLTGKEIGSKVHSTKNPTKENKCCTLF